MLKRIKLMRIKLSNIIKSPRKERKEEDILYKTGKNKLPVYKGAKIC